MGGEWGLIFEIHIWWNKDIMQSVTWLCRGWISDEFETSWMVERKEGLEHTDIRATVAEESTGCGSSSRMDIFLVAIQIETSGGRL